MGVDHYQTKSFLDIVLCFIFRDVHADLIFCKLYTQDILTCFFNFVFSDCHLQKFRQIIIPDLIFSLSYHLCIVAYVQ